MLNVAKKVHVLFFDPLNCLKTFLLNRTRSFYGNKESFGQPCFPVTLSALIPGTACGRGASLPRWKKAPPFAPTYPSKGGGLFYKGGFLNWYTPDIVGDVVFGIIKIEAKTFENGTHEVATLLGNDEGP